MSSTENTKITEYLANELNQYTDISTTLSSLLSSPSFDSDGNMTFDGREWHYTWNGENRLILASNAAHTVTYAYDHMGRMVSKELLDVSNNYKLTTKNFLWDRWNIISETAVSPSAIPNSSLPITNCTHYAWGLDLSGTLQGAGGVGGLLAVANDKGLFAPTYDVNGNITEYVSLITDPYPQTTSPIAAHYEYDASGNIAAQSGSMSDVFAFRFSTKCWEPETAILHYELRPYSPSFGRFLPRDPIGERGGLNLYGFVRNTSLNSFDRFGLYGNPVTGPDGNPIGPANPYDSNPYNVKDREIKEHFKQLKEQLKDDLKAMCPEKPTEWSKLSLKTGRKEATCCTPEDCKGDAERMANEYIKFLQEAFEKRKAPGGYWGNAAILCMGSSGQSWSDDKNIGLMCGGWTDMAEQAVHPITEKSDCWQANTEKKDPGFFYSLLMKIKVLSKDFSPHMWVSLQVMDGVKIPLDPWSSGGRQY
jgi:RHS repeat-associated core domain